MKNTLIMAGLLLLAVSAQAQDTPKNEAAVKVIVGNNRPDPANQREANRKDARLTYWNDSFDHMSVTMQDAANAYSADDLHQKGDKHTKRHK